MKTLILYVLSAAVCCTGCTTSATQPVIGRFITDTGRCIELLPAIASPWLNARECQPSEAAR